VPDDVLNRVATFFEKDLSLRQKVRAAITYPAAIFIFALGVIFFLVFFILPQFIGFFKGMDLVLPLPTRFLIFSTELLTGYWYVFLGFFLLGLYGFRMYVNTPAGRFRFDQFKLRVLVFGPLVRKVIISRFTRTLGTLISSGVPIMQALEVVAKAVENKVVSQAIENVRSSIREGESIAIPMQSSGLFPPMVVQMTALAPVYFGQFELYEPTYLPGRVGSAYAAAAPSPSRISGSLPTCTPAGNKSARDYEEVPKGGTL